MTILDPRKTKAKTDYIICIDCGRKRAVAPANKWLVKRCERCQLLYARKKHSIKFNKTVNKLRKQIQPGGRLYEAWLEANKIKYSDFFNN